MAQELLLLSLQGDLSHSGEVVPEGESRTRPPRLFFATIPRQRIPSSRGQETVHTSGNPCGLCSGATNHVKKENPAKAHYQKLRQLGCHELWHGEVATFNRSDAALRLKNVAVVRAVGVVFSESGTPDERVAAKEWLQGLLKDPEEKIRRYAMAALPKLGGAAEAELLAIFRSTDSEREKHYAGRALEKVGGTTARSELAGGGDLRALRKVEANVARTESPGRLVMDTALEPGAGLRIHFRCRSGLEDLVAGELSERSAQGLPFEEVRRHPGLVIARATGPLTLAEVYSLRCFASVGFVPGSLLRGGDPAVAMADLLTSAVARRIFETFTDGRVRYRLEFPDRGHQRQLIRRIGDLAYEKCPALLNDSREALWQVDLRPESGLIELIPRLRPDPRFAYRTGDVPAASHPPLAACMARLAEIRASERVWDPFCGSGLELVEADRFAPGCHLIGTDRSAAAIEKTGANLASAGIPADRVTLAASDFRDVFQSRLIEPGSVSAIITNPPLGRRVQIANLHGLMQDLFDAAAAALAPGGRLVFVNPLAIVPRDRRLKKTFSRRVDLGGFSCYLEKYTASGSRGACDKR